MRSIVSHMDLSLHTTIVRMATSRDELPAELRSIRLDEGSIGTRVVPASSPRRLSRGNVFKTGRHSTKRGVRNPRFYAREGKFEIWADECGLSGGQGPCAAGPYIELGPLQDR